MREERSSGGRSRGRQRLCAAARTKRCTAGRQAAAEADTVAISHGEGRFVAPPELLADMAKNGQIATQYVDMDGNPTMDIHFNPNTSMMAIEGITSPDGRVLGKMGHSERIGQNLYRNVPGEKDQKIFESGVAYFK